MTQSPPDPRWVIAEKRDGQELSPGVLRSFIDAFVRGDVADYQMSAFLMAAFLRGMTDAETEAAARAMIESGEQLSWEGIPGPFVDKHSTGGVGDKISILLAPLLACLGVRVPMISGRGLGHTGGTLDKLESIPGFRVELASGEMRTLLEKVGMFVAGQSPSLVPADRKLYALRDVTSTVASTPLIVSSILSKKAAAGVRYLVLDVKYGEGAFMETLPRARGLAEKLVQTAGRLGIRAVAILSRMEGILGRTAGNAVEVAESIEVLSGKDQDSGVARLTEWLGGALLALSGRAKGIGEGRELIREALSSGKGLERFEQWVAAQGGIGDSRKLLDALPSASQRTEVRAPSGGYVSRIGGRGVGHLLIQLGGGRLKVGDRVDPSVGVVLLRPPGTKVRQGEPVLEVLHEKPISQVSTDDLQSLIEISAEPPVETPLIGGIVTDRGFSADPEAASLGE